MGLFDFDFSAIERIVSTMSDEEKQQMMDTAANMMNSMDLSSMQQQAQEIEEEDSPALEDFLSLDDALLEKLDGKTLEQLEAAMDLEVYYEDSENADLSGSALFLAKAVLTMLRAHVAPLLAASNQSGFDRVEMTDLSMYLSGLAGLEADENLDENLIDPDTLMQIHQGVITVCSFLQKAQSDSVSADELGVLKTLLVQDGLLEQIALADDHLNKSE